MGAARWTSPILSKFFDRGADVLFQTLRIQSHFQYLNRQRRISRQTTSPLHLNPRRGIDHQIRQRTSSALQTQYKSLTMLFFLLANCSIKNKKQKRSRHVVMCENMTREDRWVRRRTEEQRTTSAKKGAVCV